MAEETAAQKAKREAAERDEAEKRERASSTKDRAAREAAAGDVGDTRTGLVGGIAVTQPQAPLEGVMAEAAGNLLERATLSANASEVPAPGPTDEQIAEESKRIAAREKDAPALDRPLLELERALAEHAVGDPLTVDDLNPPAPGQTERGWSPEVTARHPQVQAHYIERILSESGGGATPRSASRSSEPSGVDPLDREALVAAQREIGFHDVRMTMLKNEATRRASDDLAAAEEAASRATPAFAVAAESVMDEIKTAARSAGHKID